MLTLSNLPKKAIKSAHSLTLSKVANALSMEAAYLLNFGSEWSAARG